MSYSSKKTSPKKHSSRWRFYGHLKMPAKYLHKGYHILIPSTDCGDLEVLIRHLEVDKNMILAADLDPKAVAAAREYGVEARCEDILATLERALNHGKKIQTLNLDFCDSPVKNAHILATALRANVEWVMYTFSQRSGKNMPSREARRKHIIETCGQEPFDEWDYSSDTKYSKGSAMTCMIFRGSGEQPHSLYPTVEVEDTSAEVEALIDQRSREMVKEKLKYVSPEARAIIQRAMRNGSRTAWEIYYHAEHLSIASVRTYLCQGNGQYWKRTSPGVYKLI